MKYIESVRKLIKLHSAVTRSLTRTCETMPSGLCVRHLDFTLCYLPLHPEVIQQGFDISFVSRWLYMAQLSMPRSRTSKLLPTVHQEAAEWFPSGMQHFALVDQWPAKTEHNPCHHPPCVVHFLFSFKVHNASNNATKQRYAVATLLLPYCFEFFHFSGLFELTKSATCAQGMGNATSFPYHSSLTAVGHRNDVKLGQKHILHIAHMQHIVSTNRCKNTWTIVDNWWILMIINSTSSSSSRGQCVRSWAQPWQ